MRMILFWAMFMFGCGESHQNMMMEWGDAETPCVSDADVPLSDGGVPECPAVYSGPNCGAVCTDAACLRSCLQSQRLRQAEEICALLYQPDYAINGRVWCTNEYQSVISRSDEACLHFIDDSMVAHRRWACTREEADMRETNLHRAAFWECNGW